MRKHILPLLAAATLGGGFPDIKIPTPRGFKSKKPEGRFLNQRQKRKRARQNPCV